MEHKSQELWRRRRRINTEEKAMVAAAAWGKGLAPCRTCYFAPE